MFANARSAAMEDNRRRALELGWPTSMKRDYISSTNKSLAEEAPEDTTK